MMAGSQSLMGGHSQDTCFDVGMCPDVLVAMVAAMAGLGFTMLYQAVTVAAGGGGRRRRDSDKSETLLWLGIYMIYFSFFLAG